MEHDLDSLSGPRQLDAFVNLIQRKNMGNELLCRECRGYGQLECPLRLAVGCAKVAFDPNVVIVDQVTVQFGHRALGNASKEYDQASLFYHMNALRLGWH